MTTGSDGNWRPALALALCCGVLSGCVSGMDALRVEPPEVRLTKAGNNAAKRGDLATAAALYNQAHASNPSETTALKALATTFYRLESYHESAEAWRSVIAAAPDDPDAFTGLGLAQLSLARIDDARDAFVKSLTLRPQDARTLMADGVALDLSGRHAEAQARYQAALAMKPDDIAIRNNLALSYAFAGNLDRAITLLREVADNAKAGPRNRANLALVLILDNKLDAAESVLSVDNVKEDVDRWIREFEALLPLTGADLARAVFNLDRKGGNLPAISANAG